MRKLTITPALLLILLLAAGCDPAVRFRPVPAEPVEVHSVPVRLEQVSGSAEISGTVRSLVSAELAARVMGEVLQVDVQVGDRVRRGQLLVRLDDRESRAAVSKIDAAAQELQQIRRETDSAVQAARSRVDQALSDLTLAEATFGRFQRLLQREAVSRQEFDEVQAKRDGAKAGTEAARAQLNSLLSRQPQLDAREAQIAADRSSAQTRLEFTDVRAPFDGVVLERRVDPGDLASPSSPLLILEEPQYQLEVNVEESLLSNVQVGNSVDVRIGAFSEALTGTVTRIAPGADPQTRTTLVKVGLPGHSQLRSGQFGRIVLPGKSQSILTVSNRALVQRGQLQGVFVVRQGQASFRVLRLGKSRPRDRTVVNSGLSQGDQVIVDPSSEIRDGVPIRVISNGAEEQRS